MNELKNFEGLDNLFQLIADKLGVASSMVEANAMEYILEYGRFMSVRNSIFGLICGIFIVIGIIVLGAIIDEDFNFKYSKRIFTGVSIISVMVLALSGTLNLILYKVSPFVYSIRKIMDLLN